MTPVQNIEQARFNMVEQQIRTWDVLNQEILDLLYRIHREDFVPEAYRSLAFCDLEIPLGDAPVMSARMISKNSSSAIHQDEMFETCAAPLDNAQQPVRFQF